VIQQNASASEEMSSTAEELSSQAEQLQEAIAFFKLATAGNRQLAAGKKGKAVHQRTEVHPGLARHGHNGDGQLRSTQPTGAELSLAGPDGDDAEFERY
jgi:methyl-accepting chemotaxis protein